MCPTISSYFLNYFLIILSFSNSVNKWTCLSLLFVFIVWRIEQVSASTSFPALSFRSSETRMDSCIHSLALPHQIQPPLSFPSDVIVIVPSPTPTLLPIPLRSSNIIIYSRSYFIFSFLFLDSLNVKWTFI